MVLRVCFFVRSPCPSSVITKRRRSQHLSTAFDWMIAPNRISSHHKQEIKIRGWCFRLAWGNNPAGRERRTLQASRSQLSSPKVSRAVWFTYCPYLFIDGEVAVILGWWPNGGGSMSGANHDSMATRIRRLSLRWISTTSEHRPEFEPGLTGVSEESEDC